MLMFDGGHRSKKPQTKTQRTPRGESNQKRFASVTSWREIINLLHVNGALSKTETNNIASGDWNTQ
jgi:hypothetical protein